MSVNGEGRILLFLVNLRSTQIFCPYIKTVFVIIVTSKKRLSDKVITLAMKVSFNFLTVIVQERPGYLSISR